MPPYKHINGTVHEKHRNNKELKFAWKIPRIFSKTKVGYQIVSAPLRWLETSWRLVIYPNGIEGLEPGWVDLSLTSSCVPMNPVRVTFGFLKSGKTEYFVLHDQKYGTQNQRYHNIRFMKKADLVKRRGSLPYTTMNIICIIRVENSSLVEANAIPSTNLGVTGRIDLPVRQPNDRLTVEWKILRPFTLGSQPGDYYSSPEFVFLNTKWRLRVYPFGHPIKEYEDWIGVDVWKLNLSSCKRPVLLTVSIKQASAKEGTIYKNETLADYRRLWTGYQLAKRSKLKDKLFYDEALTIVCTLRADEVPSTSAAADACDEMGPPATELADGIFENYRTAKELNFEWRISEFSSKMDKVGDRFTSPIIEFLNMSWILKIYPSTHKPTESTGWIAFDIWKLDWTSEPQPVFISLGIKKTDSTEDVIFSYQKLPGHRRLWRANKFLLLPELHRRKFYIAFADMFTITCTLCSQKAYLSRISETKIVSAEPDGLLRERECNFHKEVEWDFNLSYHQKTSPVFTMGNQTFHMKVDDEFLGKKRLDLYAVGPPIGLPDPAIWWAGLKRNDGSFLFPNTSGVVNLARSKTHYLQTHLLLVKGEDITRELKSTDVTVFLRFKVERETKSEENCSHSVAVVPSDPKGYGVIQYIPCEYHVQAEWLIEKPLCFLINLVSWKSDEVLSPDINCLDEKFKLKWVGGIRSVISHDFVLNVYSKRMSTSGPYREGHWWVAVRRPDGTYLLTNVKGTLDAENACHMWTFRGSITVPYSEGQRGELSVILRYTSNDVPKDPDFSCVHSGSVRMRTTATGRLKMTKFPLYMDVEWTVDYALTFTLGDVTPISPDFMIGTQRYLLELRPDPKDEQMFLLYLHRLGEATTTPPRYIRWWAGLKRRDGTFYYKNRRGKVDLQEDCEIWNQMFLLKTTRTEVDSVPLANEEDHLVVFCRLSEDWTSYVDEDECTIFLPEPKRQRINSEDTVIFSVRDREFIMSKSIIKYRVPVLFSMFRYDTVEKRTGIVSIEDSEPVVFEDFLHYITYGFIRKPNEYSAFDGYVVADKYLLEDLKTESLQVIRDTISVHSFCDTFSFSLTFGEDELLKHALDFFANHYSLILQTDEWSDYLKHDRTTAEKLNAAARRRTYNCNKDLYELFSTKRQ